MRRIYKQALNLRRDRDEEAPSDDVLSGHVPRLR